MADPPMIKREQEMVLQGFLHASEAMEPTARAEYATLVADLTRIFMAHPDINPKDVFKYMDDAGRARMSYALMICGCMLYRMFA